MADEAIAPERRAGDVIAGRYSIIGLLGSGGMGAVYEVEHINTRRRLAMKTLHAGFGDVPEYARRFEREAKATNLLNHPNIVEVLDFGTLPDGSLFLIMELVRGVSLADLLDAGVVEPARGIAIMAQVLDALAHAHAIGIIHRDLKPENIMLTEGGGGEGDHVKLLDFGIAKLVGDAEAEVGGEKLTQAGIAFGTPDYMSPEQACGMQADGRADLYAAGVILFEILAGRRPFVSDDLLEVVRMHVMASAPTLSSVAPARAFSHELDTFVARALAKRREDRFSSAAEMHAALESAVREVDHTLAHAHTILDAPAPAASPEPRRPALDRRIVRGLAIGLPVMFLLAIVIAVATDGGTNGPVAADQRPQPSSELASRAQALFAQGDPAAAAELLEDEVSRSPGDRDGEAHLLLGHARAALGKPAEALTVYERALALDPELAADAELRTNLLAQASRGRTAAVRHRALDLAERAGIGDRVDRVESYALDLQQGASCKDRREAVAKLRALGDPRAIAPLKRARRVRSGLFNDGHPNRCLEKDAAEAITFLEAMPSRR